jgi:bacteriocin biosynthesis cyclodehydratase domain-containing protein
MSGRVVQIAAGGAFAHALTGSLWPALCGAGYAVTVEPADRAAPPVHAERAAGIVVADHADPVLAGYSGAWRARGFPSLEVVQNHPDIRIGPLDVPGTDLCGRCFAARANPGRGTAREPHPDAGLAVSVDGYPPYLIALVVALILDRLRLLHGGPVDRRNEVTVVNASTLVIRTFPVVPVLGCPRCADQQPLRQPMFPELKRVLG